MANVMNTGNLGGRAVKGCGGRVFNRRSGAAPQWVAFARRPRLPVTTTTTVLTEKQVDNTTEAASNKGRIKCPPRNMWEMTQIFRLSGLVDVEPASTEEEYRFGSYVVPPRIALDGRLEMHHLLTASLVWLVFSSNGLALFFKKKGDKKGD